MQDIKSKAANFYAYRYSFFLILWRSHLPHGPVKSGCLIIILK